MRLAGKVSPNRYVAGFDAMFLGRFASGRRAIFATPNPTLRTDRRDACETRGGRKKDACQGAFRTASGLTSERLVLGLR